MYLTDVANWLLDAETPSIRYLTARDLLKLPASDERLTSARQAIMMDGPVPAILAKQTPTGQWADEHSFYTPKYVSTHWSLMLLTELCVDPDDERFQRGVDFMLTATAEEMQHALVSMEGGWSCFWGNLLRYAFYAGRGDDPRVGSIVEYAVRDLTNEHCRCKHNDGFSCAWGVVRTLWGLAALPSEKRSSDVTTAIEYALPFLLENFRLVEANYPTPTNGKVHSLWFKLNFPVFYQVDILFSLRLLADLGELGHPGVAAALDWLEAQRMRSGHWRGRSPYRQRTWHELGDGSESSRWVSLQAATILQQAGRLDR